MDLSWTEEQIAYKNKVVAFAKEQLTTNITERDASLQFSRDDWQKCADFGIQGLAAPQAFGGFKKEIDILTATLAMEGLGYGCKDNGLPFSLNAQMWTVQLPIAEFGTEAQKDKYLDDILQSNVWWCQGYSEPGAGSDLASLRTSAVRDGDDYIKASGSRVDSSFLERHLTNILAGLYSLAGTPDVAIVENLVESAPSLAKYSHQGVPDIRIIVFQGYPVMAMLRLATTASDGKANLHQGAVGVGLDIGSGRGLNAVQFNRPITLHPDTGLALENIQIEAWDEMLEMVAYFEKLWEIRLHEPGDDLVSMLVHGEATKHLPTMAHLGNLLLLIVGGNDTTRNTMSGSVYGLNQFPDQYDMLTADPELVPKMVPEIIRWQTPLAYMRRTALEDVTLHGKTIRKGEQVAMWYISANRDEEFWDEDPNALIIDRKQAKDHISFGFGIHRCYGSRLAELQLRILWEEILDRFEHIEVLDEPSRTSSAFVHGYTWLPVVCHRK